MPTEEHPNLRFDNSCSKTHFKRNAPIDTFFAVFAYRFFFVYWLKYLGNNDGKCIFKLRFEIKDTNPHRFIEMSDAS